MTFFDKLGEAAKNLTEKATDTIEVTKISSKISTEKGVITALKGDLGEILWNKYQAGEVSDETITEVCAKIQASLDTIEGYEAEIAKIKAGAPKPAAPVAEAAAKCASCGAELKEGAKFCLECGTKVEVAQATKVCPACGISLPADAKFCPECGYRFE